MAVRIAHARYDENGNISGGVAGDQTGKEVIITNWYRHSKGWVVLRPNDMTAADRIALAAEAACHNNRIGYDQRQRNTLYNAVKALGFDPSRVKTDVETDCSALVRVCLGFAGIMVPDFNTSTQVATLMKTGLFTKLTDAKYTRQDDYLRRGDILVTVTKGHTGTAIDNGDLAGKDGGSGHTQATIPGMPRPVLRRGSRGEDVKALQTLLINNGYALPRFGADGGFGAETEDAVKGFQYDRKLVVDGIVGAKTWAALGV